jgi:KaiC/GvpD/RAD55 family RecA-like ATPase
MSVWIVLLVIFVVLLVLAVGGAVTNARRERATRRPFDEALHDVDGALANALAGDRGWEPSVLVAAVHRELAQRRPGEEVRSLRLVKVVDRPGTDADEAVYRCELERGAVRLSLARRGDEWLGARLEDA